MYSTSRGLQPLSLGCLVINRRKGEIAVFLACLIGSGFPIIAILSFSSVSPLFSAAASTLIGALFFAAVLALRKGFRALYSRPPAWREIVLTSVYIGFLFHAFLYLGLRYTTAGNAAILLLLEVFFSFAILGFILRQEEVFASRIAGALLMTFGALVVLIPNATEFNGGDFLVVFATLFGPLGNKYAKEARLQASTEEIMFWRSIFAGFTLLVLAFCLEVPPAAEDLRACSWSLVVNGIVVFGISKILWLEGINLIPITVAVSLISISPAFTMVLAYFVLGEPITAFQVLGLPLLASGIILVTRNSPRAVDGDNFTDCTYPLQ